MGDVRSTRYGVEEYSKMYLGREIHGLISIISNFGTFSPGENVLESHKLLTKVPPPDPHLH